jgi:hypothetical protein
VPRHDLVQGGRQGRGVQLAGHQRHQLHVVVDGIRGQLVEEPQALLCEGQRQVPVPGHRHDRAGHRTRFAGRTRHQPVDEHGQLGDGRPVEHGGQRQLDPEQGAHPGDDPGGE